MENNWKEVAINLIEAHKTDVLIHRTISHNIDDYIEILTTKNAIEAILKAMNLIFEATKKECADKAIMKLEPSQNPLKGNFMTFDRVIDKNSILNIKKPNL